jgi:hypothetical protein
LKAFLERELDFYLKNEVLNMAELATMNEQQIKMMKAKISVLQSLEKK